MPGPEPERSTSNLAAAMRQAAAYAGLALAIPAAAFVGFAIGYVLDRQWGTHPLFAIIFALMGFGGGLLEVLRTVARSR